MFQACWLGAPSSLRSYSYRPAIASTSALRKRSTTSMNAIEGMRSSSAVIDAIDAGYCRFLRGFGGVIERFRRARTDDHHPEQAFVVRTLLIHKCRRVLLRDPRLPAALLPLDWPGAAAYAHRRDCEIET
jgi:DNA-binding transcriptional regulator PaaX